MMFRHEMLCGHICRLTVFSRESVWELLEENRFDGQSAIETFVDKTCCIRQSTREHRRATCRQNKFRRELV